MTSIGIWLLSCIMFVFGAVSEYAGLIIDICPHLSLSFILFFSVILFLKRKMEDRTHCSNGSALHASTLNMNKVIFYYFSVVEQTHEKILTVNWFEILLSYLNPGKDQSGQNSSQIGRHQSNNSPTHSLPLVSSWFNLTWAFYQGREIFYASYSLGLLKSKLLFSLIYLSLFALLITCWS